MSSGSPLFKNCSSPLVLPYFFSASKQRTQLFITCCTSWHIWGKPIFLLQQIFGVPPSEMVPLVYLKYYFLLHGHGTASRRFPWCSLYRTPFDNSKSLFRSCCIDFIISWSARSSVFARLTCAINTSCVSCISKVRYGFRLCIELPGQYSTLYWNSSISKAQRATHKHAFFFDIIYTKALQSVTIRNGILIDIL